MFRMMMMMMSDHVSYRSISLGLTALKAVFVSETTSFNIKINIIIIVQKLYENAITITIITLYMYI